MSELTPNPNPWLAALENQMQKTCFCKWRTECTDKNSDACYAKRNVYAEKLTRFNKAKP